MSIRLRPKSEPTPELPPSALPALHWSGNSLLLRRVLSIFERFAREIPEAPKPHSRHSLPTEILIHDGSASPDLEALFTLDFNIHDYGDTPDRIAEALWNRIHSCLV